MGWFGWELQLRWGLGWNPGNNNTTRTFDREEYHTILSRVDKSVGEGRITKQKCSEVWVMMCSSVHVREEKLMNTRNIWGRDKLCGVKKLPCWYGSYEMGHWLRTPPKLYHSGSQPRWVTELLTNSLEIIAQLRSIISVFEYFYYYCEPMCVWARAQVHQGLRAEVRGHFSRGDSLLPDKFCGCSSLC